MSEEEKENMTGRSVAIFLKTPLFQFRYKMGDEEKTLMENTVRISGGIIAESAGGFLVEVDEISNMKDVDQNPPFQDIFVPFDKIDYMLFIDA